MVSSDSIEGVFGFLQGVRKEIVSIQFGISFINQWDDFHEVAFKWSSTRPARGSKALHADWASNRHMASTECKTWWDHSDEEGIVGIVLWEDYFVLEFDIVFAQFLGYRFEVFL